MCTMVKIRPEETEDIQDIYNINVNAFGREGEAGLVGALRREAGLFISLVAEEDGSVIGHILFTHVAVGDSDVNAAGLGPMAVSSGSQGKGVGKKLIEQGLEICREKGIAAVFVLGHPDYYMRFGFQECSAIDIYYKDEQFAPYFFYKELKKGSLEGVKGKVKYSEAFDNV
jgi:putative acetyltransferase